MRGRPALAPAAIPLAGWAAFLALSTAVQILLGGHLLPVALLGGAAALSALIAVGIVAGARRRALSQPSVTAALAPEASPDVSAASAILAVALCALLAGASVGGWLVIGAAILGAGGLALLARELRSERRSRDQARRGGR